MSFSTLLQSVGSIGFFSSRAFLPAFVSALVVRFGPQLPFFADTTLVQATEGTPSWFTSDVCLWALGLLSAAEFWGSKQPDVRNLLDQFDGYMKAGMATLTTLGIASSADAAFVEETIRKAGLGDVIPAVLIGGGALWLASVRGAVLSPLGDADQDDESGVQRLLSWAEDLWAFFGPLLLILFPLVMLGVIAIVTGIMTLMRRRALKREEQSKVPCASCGESCYSCAPTCASCGASRQGVHAIGVFGQSLDEVAPDPAAQPYLLAAKRRCPVCATRLEVKDVHQTCPTCQHGLFRDPSFGQEYVARVGRRLPLVLVICALMSLVPIVGLIPGVIYYRLTLVAPFRRYIPFGQDFAAKWGIRILFILLVAFQWVPLAGGVVVPAMALVSFLAYRGLFVSNLEPSEAAGSAAA